MTKVQFLKPVEYYQRNIDPITDYVNQSSFYLSKMTDSNLTDCKNKLLNHLRVNKTSAFADPAVHFFNRNDVKDRERRVERLSTVIKEIKNNNEILTPTFTTYIHPTIEESDISAFIEHNVAKRSKSKNESFEYKAAGNVVMTLFKNNEQNNMKNYNNSMSGAFASQGTVFLNPTGHSTLTSVTRTESSLGNASNEKIISGNRHYKDPLTTLNNLIYITSTLDREAISKVINKYSLKIPTINDVNDCVRWSTDFYWRDPLNYKLIENFIDKLDDIERAGIVYTGDLFHIRKHNEDFTRLLLKDLSSKITEIIYDNPTEIIHSVDEQMVNYAHLICMSEMRGKGKKYNELSKESLNTLAATCKNIENVVVKYFDFFETLFLSNVIPSSTAYISTMMRRSVVLSDTDSTMFSTDDYVQWYFKELKFNDESYALAGAVMFIATQCIAHCLAIFSANMNVDRAKIFKIQMKPEYTFPLFAQSPVAKHYFTWKIVQEGNVFDEPEMEIKGVHLKNSALPKSIVTESQSRMKEILTTVTNTGRYELLPEIKRVANLERHIKQSLLKGELEFYKQSKIKDKGAYSLGPERSPYQHHILWETVFQDKYGKIEQLPYSVIKIPTTLVNSIKLKEWLENIEDRDIGRKLNGWCVTFEKKALPTMYISVQHVLAYGIPKEIIPVINFEKIILDLTVSRRMILETLGFCPKHRILISSMGY